MTSATTSVTTLSDRDLLDRTEENHRRVLDEARSRSKRKLDELVARLAPRPDVPTMVRRIPERTRGSQAAMVGESVPGPLPSVAESAGREASGVMPPSHAALEMLAEEVRGPEALAVASATPAAVAESASPALTTSVHASRRHADTTIAPLAPARYKVQFTVGQDTHDRLRRVQTLLRREIPGGDAGAIFDRALVLLAKDLERKKCGAADRQRPSKHTPKPGSRDIPTAVMRAVQERDAGRCAFVAEDGTRCPEREFLEYHHCHPYALNGPATVDNIELRCHPHNVYESELVSVRGAQPSPTSERVESDDGSDGRSDLRATVAFRASGCLPHG